MSHRLVFWLSAGLLGVGCLFFGIGFVTALLLYPPSPHKQQRAPNWISLNEQLHPPSSSQSSGPLESSGPSSSSQVFKNLLNESLQSGISDELTSVQSRFSGGVLLDQISHLPPALQPFARQAENHVMLQAQQNIGEFSQTIEETIQFE